MSGTTGFCQQSWLVVAQGGGWWRTREIVDQLPSGLEVDEPSSLLWVMAKRYGYLARRGRGQNAEYAVTPECITPRGLTVAQVNRALRGQITNGNQPAIEG